MDTPGQQEQRQDDEELDGVPGEDHRRIFPEGTQDDAAAELSGELRGKGRNTQRKGPDERFDQREEQFLQSLYPLDDDTFSFAVRHPGQGQAHGDRDQQDGKHIPGQERLHDVVRDDRYDMVVE